MINIKLTNYFKKVKWQNKLNKFKIIWIMKIR